MNKVQKWLINNRQYFTFRVALATFMVFLTILTMWFNFRFSVYSPPETSVEELIKQGDDAFRDYQYNQALDTYHRADRRTMELIKFETDSPSKDVKLLQHYHNVKTFLKVRVELTMTAQAISRLN